MLSPQREFKDTHVLHRGRGSYLFGRNLSQLNLRWDENRKKMNKRERKKKKRAATNLNLFRHSTINQRPTYIINV